MWTKADERFLRSLRIQATDPPPALPRFRVEPADLEGWYRVIDTDRRYRPVYEMGPPFADARAAAEYLARQLNEKHMASS